jgi:hypothetical protein
MTADQIEMLMRPGAPTYNEKVANVTKLDLLAFSKMSKSKKMAILEAKIKLIAGWLCNLPSFLFNNPERLMKNPASVRRRVNQKRES